VQEADALEWTTTDGAGQPVSSSISGGPYLALEKSISSESSIKRKISDNTFTITGSQQDNFLISNCPSPTATNTAEYAKTNTSAPVPTTIDVTNQACMVVEGSDDADGGSVITPTDEPPAILLPAEPQTTAANGSSSSIPSIPMADIGLAAPSITELLPNPGSPQTDSQDEFIELYNGNNMTFDLSGFQLYIGSTGSRHYTFPKGTTIPAHTFMAFFSGNTKISLSNSGGKVALHDPRDKLLVQTDEYGTAKDNQSWALANGKWQWTTKPTPNSTNIIVQPATSTKKRTAAKTTAKTSSAKTNSGSSKATTTTNDAQNTSNLEEKRPLHPLALAVVGGFALLYGAYEYRHDVANKFYQLRSYRAARRKTRQQLKGR